MGFGVHDRRGPAAPRAQRCVPPVRTVRSPPGARGPTVRGMDSVSLRARVDGRRFGDGGGSCRGGSRSSSRSIHQSGFANAEGRTGPSPPPSRAGVTERRLLLLDALIRPAKPGFEAWRQWRASANLDCLDNASFLLLPALAHRLPEWLADDPRRDILLGICRRAWSQVQLRRKMLAEAAAVLRASGVETQTAAGPVAWADRYWPQGSIRPIDTLDLTVAPRTVKSAVSALAQAEWAVKGRVPQGWFWSRFEIGRAS